MVRSALLEIKAAVVKFILYDVSRSTTSPTVEFGQYRHNKEKLSLKLSEQSL